MVTSEVISQDLPLINKIIVESDRLNLTHFTPIEERNEYCACSFKLNDKYIIYRNSRITPAKTGQFVAIWKRNELGVTVPYDYTDNIDFLVISARNDENIGLFIFAKSVLLEKGMLAGNNSHGKRGIRIYPPWDKTTNKQAEKTQQWQINYFFDFSTSSVAVTDKITQVFITNDF